jgi:hypothetical protein
MADALTSGFKTYGEIRTRIGVFVAIVVAICFCVFGWVTVLSKDKHTAKTSGILSDASCSANTCTATALYGLTGVPSPSPAPYKFTSTWGAGMTNGRTVDVYYDPANPRDASAGPVPKWLGWTFIGIATLLVLCSILFMQFFSGLSNQGKAVVGGLEATSDVMSFLRKN